MKKLILFFIGVAALLTSCDFKDKGNLTLTPISPIIIDTTGIPLQHTYSQGTNLEIRPKVSREGIGPEDFSYEWRLTRVPGTDFTLYDVISTEKDLDVPITTVRPDADYYSLWYKVTDKTNGLMASVVFRVVVEAPVEQGLVVADSDDGVTSDLSVIQDTLFTFNYYEKGTTNPLPTLIKRNEYSKANGGKFDGVIHSLYAQRLYEDGQYSNFLHGASDHNAFRLNSSTYKVVASGRQLFYDPVVDLNINYYFQNGQSQNLIINDGKVCIRLIESKTSTQMRKFGIVSPGDYMANRHIAVHPTTVGNAIFYDETLGKFLRLGTSLNVKAAPLEDPRTPQPGDPFDTKNLPGYTVLGGGLGNLSEARFVMKKDNFYGVFCLINSGTAATIGNARRLIDISDAPDIANAVDFVFPIDQAVIYYATPSKVYSIRIPQGGSPVYTELYTSPEPITMLEMLRRSGTKTVTYSERCLLAITYNGSEGKITALPIPPTGLDLGLIDLSRKATFGGFKRISAVAVQD